MKNKGDDESKGGANGEGGGGVTGRVRVSKDSDELRMGVKVRVTKRVRTRVGMRVTVTARVKEA